MPEKAPHVLFLAHDPQIPSFRLRLKPMGEALAGIGAEVAIRTVRRGREGFRLIPLLPELRRADLVVVSKFKFFGPERSLVRAFSGPWVYDVDDAVMYGKPKVHGRPPDMAQWRQARFAAMCRGAALVVTATKTLAGRVPEGVRTEVLPTPVDCATNPVSDPREGKDGPILTWIGLGENLRYLADLYPMLNEAFKNLPGLRLRVVSDGLPASQASFPVELIPWFEATQGRNLAAAGIGLAPLPEDLWTTGKGGYKIIQYLAAGLPVLASPLEAQREIGGPHGEAVLYCGPPEEWISSLKKLAGDPALCARMGAAARRRAEELFDVRVVSTKYAELILDLARQRM
jgi:glycosyltransferase involved in cell wall biosynthesis